MRLLLDTHAFLWFLAGDRLLIAQALVEDIPVVSQDGAFDGYEVRRIG